MSRPGDRPRNERGIPRQEEEKGPPKKAADAPLGPSAAAGGLSRPAKDEGAPWRRRLSVEEESEMSGHELRDMRIPVVIRWLALLAVAVTGLVILVTVFERSVVGHVGPIKAVVDVVPQVTPPPEPRLEQENGEILAALRAKEDKVLNNYTWIDQAAGKVSLPIDRAIELTAQRGLPVRSQPSGQATPAVMIPQSSSSGRTLETIP